MHFIKNTILIGLVLSLVVPSFAQNEFSEFDYDQGTKYSNIVLALNRLEVKQSKKSTHAQNMYDGLGFAKSASMFKQSLDIDNRGRAVWSNLANAARLNANYNEAAYWYSKVIQDGPLPEDLLHYAQALQANGNCQEAVTWFKKYNASPATNKVSFINNCSELDNYRVFDQVSLNNLAELNSKHLDFSAQPFGEGIVFTSNRGSNKFSKLVDNWTSNNFTDLFYTEKTETGYSKPKVLQGAVNGKFHDGVATFDADNTMMFFTRNNYAGRSANGVKNLKIFSVNNSDNINWSNATELPFNSDDFSNCHPTLSNDGKTLYFSSDRPGGFGGMDIYKVSMTDGSWGVPQNVGPSINTAGNEIFPFVTAQEDLAFSSNGHPGFGGLDLFVARQTNMNSGNWDRLINAGKPFNSLQDDFGFYMNEENINGFMSSSRTGVAGNDDIFEWTSAEAVDFFPVLSREQVFCVVESDTKTPLNNASLTVTMMEDGEQRNETLTTNSKGEFAVTVWPNTKLNMDITRTGFINKKESWMSSTANAPESTCIYVEMKKKETVTLSGSVLNAATNSPISAAKIKVLNSCNKKVTELTSDRKGNFEIKVPCGCDFEISGEKNDFVNSNKTLKASSLDCSGEKDVKLKLKSAKKVSTVVKTKIVPMFEGKILNIGTIIPLRNINFDFNKSIIRPDAELELNKVIALLNKYPSLSIEMGAHTDARGSAVYNMTLSSSRAQSSHEYLLKRGIQPSRISFKGYGETVLINKCADGMDCNDALHEENRRTEIKVLNY